MADIRLAKPAAGASESVQCAPEARFVFDFPTTDATLAREGDNLNIRFEDGSNLQLEGFYQQYNEENLPSFNIDGTEVAAADFFAAMNEPDLMPAAGPGTGTVANGARFHEWGDSSLTAGITHLNGLDWGFSRSFEWDDVPNAVGRNGDDWGWWAGRGNNPVTLTPENPQSVPPDTIVPGGDPEHPAPGNHGIVPPGDVRVVDEAGLRDGGTVSVNGAMLVTAPDGLASIEIAGQTIWQNGHMVGNPTFAPHDEGYFHNFAYDAGTGRLTYTYTLTKATQEHGAQGPDHIAHSLPVTVRDADGDSASSSITIVIKDDTPEAIDDYKEAVEGGSHIVSDNVLPNDTRGADNLGTFADGSAVRWHVPEGTEEHTAEDGSHFYKLTLSANGKEYGTVTLYDNGHYVLDPTTDGKDWPDGVTEFPVSYDYSIVDRDNDVSRATLNLKVVKSVPTITPGPDPDPHFPDDPSVPSDPDVVAWRELVDEGGQPEVKHETAHERQGSGSFVVNLNDETAGCSIELSDAGNHSLTITFDEESGEPIPTWDREASLTAQDVSIKVVSVQHQDDGTWRVNYSYELVKDNLDHTGGHGENLHTLSGHINITVTDTSGDSAKGMLKVEVHDDVPVVVGEVSTESYPVPEGSTIHTDSILSGSFVVSFGADGMVKETREDGTEVSFPFQYKDEQGEFRNLTQVEQDNAWTLPTDKGTLTLTLADTSDGKTSWSYDFAPNEGAVLKEADQITLYAVDGDGDRASVVIPLKLDRDPTVTEKPVPDPDPVDPDDPQPDPDPDPEPEPDPDNAGKMQVFADRITVDEGDQPQHGDKSHGHSGDSSFTVNLYGENGTVTIGEGENKVTLRLEENEGKLVEGSSVVVNGVTLSGFTATKIEGEDNTEWTISYHYKFTADQLDHGKPGADTDITLQETVGIHVTDDSGGTANAQIVVNVHDDIPTLTVTPGEEKTLTGGNEDDGTAYTYYQNFEGSLDAAFGADGPNTVEALTINGEPVVLKDGSFTYTDEHGGSLTISLNEDGSYAYRYKPADDGTEPFKRTFDVVATDGDGDQTTKVITVSQNYKPGLSGPGNENFGPEGKPLTFTLDEAAWKDATKDGQGGRGDRDHDFKGDSSFVAKFNGGEDGDITIGEGKDAYVITVSHTKDGYKVTETAGTNVIEFDGVKVTIGDIESDPYGSIRVNFHYELTGAQIHPDEKAVGSDDPLTTREIPVTITDSINGDEAKGHISFVIHDDGPEVKITDNYTATVNFGADDRTTSKAQPTFKVFTSEDEAGGAIEWGANKETDISGLGKGESLTGTLPDSDKTVTVTRNGDDSFTFSMDVEEGKSQTLWVKATDADGDTRGEPVTFSKPRINPGQPPKPGDDDTKEPEDDEGNKLNVADFALVDEGDHPENSDPNHNDEWDQEHGTHTSYSFTFTLNGEGGSLVIGTAPASEGETPAGEGEETGYYKISFRKADGAPKEGEEKIDGFYAKLDHIPTDGGITDDATGIKVSLDATDLTQVLSYDTDKKTWTVTYNAVKTEAKTHEPNEDGTITDTAMSGAIKLTVTDDSGDQAEGALKLVLHDDVPVVVGDVIGVTYTVPEGSTIHTDSTLSGSFKVDFGADGMAKQAGEDGTEVSFPFQYKGEQGFHNLTKGEGDTWTLTTDEGTLTLTLTSTSDGKTSWSYDFASNEGAVLKEANQITLYAVDGDGDRASVVIPLKLDRDPTVTPHDPKDTSKEVTADILTLDEGDHPQGHEGVALADHSKSGSFTVNLYGEDGTVTIGNDADNQVTLRLVDHTGQVVDKEGNALEGATVKVNGVQLSNFTATRGEGTEWIISYECARTEQNVTHGDPETDTDITTTDKLDITVQDGSGGMANAHIVVNLHDDLADMNVHTISVESGWAESGEKIVFGTGGTESFAKKTAAELKEGELNWKILLDRLSKDEISGTPDAHNIYYGTYGDVRFIPTFVSYDLDEAGHVVQYYDRNQSIGGLGRNGKGLHLGEDGLGVSSATSWGATGIGTADGVYVENTKDSTKVFDGSGKDLHYDAIYDTQKIGTIAESHFSEAIAIDTSINNQDIHYGLNIKLNGLGKGEKAIIFFSLAPMNSNDNTPVKVWEIIGEDGGDDKVHHIDVPDGFTKMIISAALPTPGEDSPVASSFTIKELQFTTPVETVKGAVDNISGADDEFGDVTWNWQVVKDALTEVRIDSGLHKGERYEVDFGKWDPASNSITVKLGDLIGTSASGLEPERTLFKATLVKNEDEEGNVSYSWSINKYYDFSYKSANGTYEDPNFEIPFSVTDGDNDVTEKKEGVNLSLDHATERFDNLQAGYYMNWGGKYKEWRETAIDDNAYDVMQGKDVDGNQGQNGKQGNDLMYGRGGKDIMFGDEVNYDAVGKQLLGQNYTWNPTDISGKKETDNVTIGRGQAGDNEQGNTAIWNAIEKILTDYKTAKENNKPGDLSALDNLLYEVVETPGKDGGDDALFGGVGNDILFGGAGNDFLYGTGKADQLNNNDGQIDNAGDTYSDSNMLFGGSGNDILVYHAGHTHVKADGTVTTHPGDLIEDGGRDVDILLAGGEHSLRDLLNGKEKGAPIVRNVEMLLSTPKAENVEYLGITSHSTLADYGIYMAGNRVFMNAEQWGEPTLTTAWPNPTATYIYIGKAGNYNTEIRLEVLQSVDLVQLSAGEYKTLKELGPDKLDVNAFADATGIGDMHGATASAGHDVLFSGQIGAAARAALMAAYFGDPVPAEASLEDLLAAIKKDPETAANALKDIPDSFGNVNGLAGDDVILGQNGGEGLMGDADMKGALTSALGGDPNSVGNTLAHLQKLPEGDTLAGLSDKIEDEIESQDKEHDGDDTIYGFGGTDLVYGGGGNDKIDGGADADMLFGGSGHDEIHGGDGDDFIFGGSDNDTLYGDEGDDKLLGGTGEDKLFGGSGDDYLHGGFGDQDYLDGGAGNDLIVYDASDYLIDGGADIDFLLAGDDTNLNLGELLEKVNENGEHQVRDVEVLIKGVDALSLTKLDDLADLGITVENGTVTLTGWEKAKGDPAKALVDDKEVTVTTYTNNDGLTLETTLDNEHIVLQAQLQNGNA